MILKYKCAICNNKVFETRKKLCTHIQRSHKIAGKEYYDTYISDTTEHKCIVCGKNDTEFLNIDDGYKKTCCVKCADKINHRYEKIRETFISKGYFNKSTEEPFEVQKTDDLSKYDCRQKFLYKCDECGNLKTVNKNFNKDLNDRDAFLCNKCRNYHRQIEKYVKIPLVNKVIHIDKTVNLDNYFGLQKVEFNCEQCGTLQTATIGYMRQRKRKETNFMCQQCSSKHTVRKLYGVDYICQTFTHPKFISKQSIKFFNDLIKLLNFNYKLYYNKNEFWLTDIDGSHYKYDFTDNVNKVIIEYNGDYWHPKCLNDPEWKNNRLDCNETWIYNENKKLCAERNGYKIYYIWEHDVNECYSECLSKCKLALEGKI